VNYQAYAAQYGGVIESIGGRLYDTDTYATGVTTQITFFTTLRNNLALSNMVNQGLLAAPKAFLIRAICVHVIQEPQEVARVAAASIQTGPIYNLCQIIDSGVLQLTIGNKLYGEYPLWALPAGMGVFGVMIADPALAANSIPQFAVNGVPDIRNVRTLTKPVFIGPMINFSVTIKWQAAITIVGANPLIMVIFDGDQLRPVQ
jgi:hypothetical protein